MADSPPWWSSSPQCSYFGVFPLIWSPFPERCKEKLLLSLGSLCRDLNCILGDPCLPLIGRRVSFSYPFVYRKIGEFLFEHVALEHFGRICKACVTYFVF